MIPHVFSNRLSALREEIFAAGFDGFIISRVDEYQNEMLPPCAERIAFLTGFTGSAATIIVLKEKAVFFTDGRYTLQAAQQVDKTAYVLFDGAEKTPFAWLEENISRGERVAYDPWLLTTENAEQLKLSLANNGASAIPVERNLIDIIWGGRPKPPVAPILPYDLSFAGKASAEKRQEIAALMRKKKITATVINNPASIAWLLNVRGGDVTHAPLPLSRAILSADSSVEWFVDPRKLTKELLAHVGENVQILTPENFSIALDCLARSGKTVLVDPGQTPSWISDHLMVAQAKIEQGEDLCSLPRAIKNMAELDGARTAHERDGVAVTKFLAWLDAHWEKERITEIDAERALASFREVNIHYKGPSFDTISSVGEHGAIIHYRATEESNAPLASGQIYLVDSGGQYLDGTTDVTRTVILGTPNAEMRENFTRVLKGHIALAAVRFPEGTTGAALDVLARQYLWAVGRDYSHGTGHGVGCYLSVHEGPQGISKRNKTPLKPGMILSNEPGYYKEGHYGIRIESLQTVVEISGMPQCEHKTFGFDVLTLAPIDRRLIDVSMLTEAEREWLNAYHRRVQKSLCPVLDEATASWLEAATQNIEK